MKRAIDARELYEHVLEDKYHITSQFVGHDSWTSQNQQRWKGFESIDFQWNCSQIEYHEEIVITCNFWESDWSLGDKHVY